VHDHKGSGNYKLLNNVGAPNGTQNRWAWCSKCQSLWFSGNGNARCPVSPLAYHDNAGSADYAIHIS
jgi:hypothetical protein